MSKLAKAIHSVFAFSASPRWMTCAGSMAHPANLVSDEDGGDYANEGSIGHTIASEVLKSKGKTEADLYVGKVMKYASTTITVDQEFADHVQSYVDDVRRRAIGGYLMVEQRVTLEGIEGFDESNYGTSDGIMAIPARRTALGSMPAYGIVEDLKMGQGEKVYAWEYAKPEDPFTMMYYPLDTATDEAETVVPNYQLMMYALAALADLRMLIDEPTFVRLVIHQPRMGSVQELDVPVAVLERFALFAADRLARAETAKSLGWKAVLEYPDKWFAPSHKACRWCKVPQCGPRDAKVAAEAGEDFETIIESGKAPPVPMDTAGLSRAMLAVPFIADWVKSVVARTNEMVAAGMEVMGPDGKPYKMVEGDLGDRKWADEKAVEALLLAQLPPETVYTKKLITAPQAAKLLDKKKTKAAWKDMFEPLIKRAPGQPKLALGSDTRPPYSAASDAGEFEDISDE